MQSPDQAFENKVCLVTGAAARVGAAIVRRVHTAGGRVVIHCGKSRADAERLRDELNGLRPSSAAVVQGDLTRLEDIERIGEQALDAFQRVDFIVNNASTFYATTVGQTTEDQWDDLIGVNLKAPYFLVQALAAELVRRRGAIVNLADIYAQTPLAEHPVYCATKAGLLAMTRSLARELAPEVRSNAVMPGAILWPDNPLGADQDEILARTPLARKGEVGDIADTVLFLLRDADFINGQQIAVDGGRSIVP